MFEGLINVGIDSKGDKHFYDINKIRITSHSHVSASKSSNTDSISYSIPSSDGTVNNQYMQNNEKNSQGLENSSSFSLSENINLKEKQLEIIQKENRYSSLLHSDMI